MGTVPDLIRATIARTAHPRAFVEQRGRTLQDAGLLPVNSGTSRVAARPVDCASLLLALAAAKVREAPGTVTRLGGLSSLQSGELAIAALSALVSDIWSGDRAARGATVTLDTTEPMIEITRAGRAARYWPDDQVLDMRHADTVRRRIEIPGLVIAAIGADLGIRGCRDAA